MNILRIFLLTSMVAGFSAQEAVADIFKIEQVEGTILVQATSGFEPASVGAPLLESQQFLVKPNSALLLMGSEVSCFVHVTSPGLYQLHSDLACKAGQVTQLDARLAIVPANGGANAAVAIGYGAVEPVLVGGTFVAVVAATATWQALQKKSVSRP